MPRPHPRSHSLGAFLGLVTSLHALSSVAADSPTVSIPVPSAASTVTFSSHIAEIVYRRCSPCHREGQAAPFSLVTYGEVRKRSVQLLQVIESGLMPPWLPKPGHGDFQSSRQLSDSERENLRRWVAAGSPEGDAKSIPPPPSWTTGWAHGTPDLVATMEKPYRLESEGPDVYRNFVIRVPTPKDRWVRAVELAPGNSGAVHHAFIRIDEEGQARRIDGRSGEPGFADMTTTARMPSGQLLSWNPGGTPMISPPGLAWRLPANSDLVIEMHLSRTGKPESIQASVGLYFTDEVPTNQCQLLKLASCALNFPPGSPKEVIRDSLVLPVDLDLLAVFPHAHFLCRDMQGYAIRPDGTKESLIWIPRWDFNWQAAYRYVQPVHLPKGTTLHLQYTYDNSTNNPANPNHPPKRVVYGPQSSDEMCELALQVLARNTNDIRILLESTVPHRQRLLVEGFQQRIASDPDDAESLTRLGMVLWAEGKTQEAQRLIERAVRARPDLAEAHYNQGVVLRFAGRPLDARREFETTLRLDPVYPQAHQQLAFAYAETGRLAEAERCFERALDLDPTDATAREGLDELRRILHARRKQRQPDGSKTP